MEILNIHLENCYGIRRLKHEFNFKDSKTHLIYAPNGVMKSSLTLTLEDIAEGRDSKDRIFSHRVNHRDVKVDGLEIEKDKIFVIQRMKSAEFKEVSTILANEKLKGEYDLINSKIKEAKKDFLQLIHPLAGLKNNQIEVELQTVFKQDLFKIFETYESQINDIHEPIYTNIQYSELFNERVVTFLESKDFKSKIEEYINIYDSLRVCFGIIFY